MSTRFASCFLVALGLPAAISGQPAEIPDVPDLTGVIVSAVVSEPEPRVLRFEYRLDASAASLPVDALIIALESDASRKTLSIQGLDNSQDILFSSERHRETFAPESYVAVAFPQTPPSWAVGLDADRAARWGALGEQVPFSGHALEGFVLLTRGLPGVRDVRISADTLPFLPTESELDALDLVPADLREEVEASDQVVRSVAPVAPPAQLDLASFAGEIEALRSEASAQGWIRTSELSGELSSRLGELRSSLLADDFVPAKVRAVALIDRVESSSCIGFECPASVPLTAEARALLAVNVRYLLDHIPNTPPSCSDAVASPATLWPPSKKFEPVSLGGVTDPDGDALALTITAVVQDEPPDDDCPTARIGSEGALEIWRERLGTGDGRIYTVSFSASDPVGASCSGEVRVCVPHDQGGGACVDDGVAHDATSCP